LVLEDSDEFRIRNNITINDHTNKIDDNNDICDKQYYFFVTGGSGFLGSHIINTIINNYKNSKIICLIRSNRNKTAKERLLDTLKFYKISMDSEIMCDFYFSNM
jgi:hypothetical protein